MLVPGGECHHDARAARIGEKRRQRPLDDGAPFQGSVLLGRLGAEAAPGARGGHDEPVAHHGGRLA